MPDIAAPDFAPGRGTKFVLNWETILESLRQQGWGYGYGKCHDRTTGSDIYLVNLRRGSRKLSMVKPSIEEAVTAISRLAEEEP